jgi:hypothetical protein
MAMFPARTKFIDRALHYFFPLANEPAELRVKPFEITGRRRERKETAEFDR